MGRVVDPILRILNNIVEVDRGYLTPCWIWTLHIEKNGYGRITVNYIKKLAHRYSYTVFVGEIPDGYEVDHLCNQRDCVRPEHLEAVTALVNMQRSNSPSMIVHLSGVCSQGHSMENAEQYMSRGKLVQRCRICTVLRRIS